MQSLYYREGEKLSWCPSWSNSLWQGWSCELEYYPGGNATDPIWTMLASSDRISSWTPLKPQLSNPNRLANQLWCIEFLTPPTPLIIPHRLPGFLESLMPRLPNECPRYDSKKSYGEAPLILKLWGMLSTPSLPLLPGSLKNWCSIHARCSKSSLNHSIRFCGIRFHVLNRILLHTVLLTCPHVQIAFLKFTSCNNQVLVGCIPIAAVAVHLNLKS